MTADPSPVRAALTATKVSKAFAGAMALDGFDLSIAKGEIHALVGENGSGKSTFIKILSGYHEPESGSEIRVAGQELNFGSPQSSLGVGCRFVHQDLGLVGSSSVVDNLFLTSGFPHRLGTIRTRAARAEASADLARVGLTLDVRRPVDSLSPAEKTGVAVARALRDEAGSPVRLLVLDEPTATLPESEVSRLLDIVRTVAGQGVGVLYVSHRLEEVLALAGRVTVLRDGRKVATETTTSLDRARLVHLLVGSQIDDARAAADALPSVGEETPLLRVTDLVAPAINGVSLECRAGEILGVAGITGSGSDSLLGSIFGALPRLSGTVRVRDVEIPALRPDVASKRGVAYLPPDRHSQSAVMDMSAHENLTLARLSTVWGHVGWRRGAQIALAKTWFARLRVAPPTAYRQSLQTFSGGNQQKILLAKWLRLEPSVLLLDEPTQGVDIGARAVIHGELIAAAEGGAAVVCRSTDVEELSALCQRVLVMSNNKIVTVLEGTEVTVSNISRACLTPDVAAVA